MMNINEFEKKQILFIFTSRGERLSFSNDNVIVKDTDDKIKHQSTCYRVFAIFLVGHITITSGIIQRSHKFGFPIILMTHSFRVYDVIGSKMEGNVMLRKKQYAGDNLKLARQFVLNKLQNQLWTLNQQRGKSDELRAALIKMVQHIESVKDYNGDIQGLIGLEGTAAKIYFKNHFNNIDWHGRKPRIKADFVNSTLDIGYTLLFSIVEALLDIYGFDIYQGVLHRLFYMRKSLVCDLMEPIRPLIDIQVKKAINLNQCKTEDFQIVNKRYLLNWENNSQYVAFLIEPILKHKREIFLYIQNYYRKFMKDTATDDFYMFKMEE